MFTVFSHIFNERRNLSSDQILGEVRDTLKKNIEISFNECGQDVLCTLGLLSIFAGSTLHSQLGVSGAILSSLQVE